MSRLEVTVDGHVAELTLTSPELFNRFDEQLHHEFTEALVELRGRTEVRALVLAAAGKVFSAGGDFDWVLSLHEDVAARREAVDEGKLLFRSLLDLPFPVVVALQGDAIGLGASIVLACDAVVAARSAGLADPHVGIGLVAGDGGCVSWPLSAGMRLAKRYLLTGDRIDAATAASMGLVSDLVETPDEVLPAARKLAGKIARLSPLAVQGTKRVLNNIMQQRAVDVLPLSLAAEAETFSSKDFVEAISAIQGKRKPEFRGV
jgi:enoyl-CoA hydratase